jgi:glycerol uptake facilitator-like aquaporin
MSPPYPVRSDIRRLLAEAIGTATLLLAVVGSGIMAERLSGGNAGLALLANALATGAALLVLVTILGPVSGAHFNPAVSVVMTRRSILPAASLPGYVAVQLAAAIAGVWLAHALFDLSILQVSARSRASLGQWVSEVVATAGLVLTIFGAIRHAPSSTATLVAAYIVAAYWFTASTSFANPAVTVARALTDTFAGIAPASALIFLSAQVVGAAIGDGLTRLLFDE